MTAPTPALTAIRQIATGTARMPRPREVVRAVAMRTFLTDPTRRILYIALAFALFLWVFVAAVWTLSTQLGRRRSTGIVLTAVGAALGEPAAFVGLEQALTAWNDQLGLLPWGLARILGITTYLEIPGDTAWYAAAFGAVLLVAGLALAVPGRRSRASVA